MRKPLVRAARGHPERPGRTAGEVRDDPVGDLLEIRRDVRGEREVADAGQARQPLADLRPRRVGTELDLEPAHERPHALNRQIRQRAPNRPHERVDEPRPVPALEREFLIVNDDGGQGMIMDGSEVGAGVLRLRLEATLVSS